MPWSCALVTRPIVRPSRIDDDEIPVPSASADSRVVADPVLAHEIPDRPSNPVSTASSSVPAKRDWNSRSTILEHASSGEIAQLPADRRSRAPTRRRSRRTIAKTGREDGPRRDRDDRIARSTVGRSEHPPELPSSRRGRTRRNCACDVFCTTNRTPASPACTTEASTRCSIRLAAHTATFGVQAGGDRGTALAEEGRDRDP